MGRLVDERRRAAQAPARQASQHLAAARPDAVNGFILNIEAIGR
jgi:hypothetical protein